MTISRFLRPGSYQASPHQAQATLDRRIGFRTPVNHHHAGLSRPSPHEFARRMWRLSRKRGRPVGNRDHVGSSVLWMWAGADPALQDRRIDIRRIGCRTRNAGETKGAVIGNHDRAGFLAELDESRRRAMPAGPDRRRRTVSNIAAPPADRDKAASGRADRTDRRHSIRDPHADPSEFGGGHHHGGLEAPVRRDRSIPV